jgi:hypothetical protein
MSHVKNKPRAIIEWDTENGPVSYYLTYEAALAIVREMLHRVPSITLYDYDNREAIRQNYYYGISADDAGQ